MYRNFIGNNRGRIKKEDRATTGVIDKAKTLIL